MSASSSSPSAGGIAPPLSTNSAVDLWGKALRKIEDAEKIQFNKVGDSRLTILENILGLVHQKEGECLERRWKFVNRKGETIIIRDLCEKTVKWVGRFKEVVDTVVQYDPVHAALPWAGIRTLLQVRQPAASPLKSSFIDIRCR